MPGLAKSVTDALNHVRNCTATAVFGLKNISQGEEELKELRRTRAVGKKTKKT